jgi:hypothetical protein
VYEIWRDQKGFQMQIGVTDDFERQYMAKFRAIASTYGIFVEYSIDRAARDIGLHFTQESADNKKIVVPSLAWFQMKGIMTDTLPLSEYKATNIVSVPLSTNHLRFWYVSPESTFLVIYIGSADEFLVINIKDWVRMTGRGARGSKGLQIPSIRIQRVRSPGRARATTRVARAGAGRCRMV